MAPVQYFRCLSQSTPRNEAAIEAKFDKMSNKDVIRWESIAQAFPGAIYVLKNSLVVECECDSGMKELDPRRIAAYPGEVLEVVVADQGSRDNSRSHYNINKTMAVNKNSTQDSVKALRVANLANKVNHFAIAKPVQHYPGLDRMETFTGASRVPLFTQYMINAFQNTTNSGLQTIVNSQRYQTNRIINIMTEHRAELSAEIARGNDLQHRLGVKQDRIIKLQEEMKYMQQQALDRLAIIQGRIQKVLTQNYELLEYPIPRLFIILPREPRFRDRFNPFTVPFRLYFLCECGSHTMNDSTSSPHKIHIAKHEGYDIDQPTEFLEKYGAYILAVLQMIKYGAAVAIAVVPTIAIACASEQVRLASRSIRHFKENFNNLVDDAISILQSKIESTDLMNRVEAQPDLNTVEALEGADLRQLESYLKNKDSTRTLGNLYRIVTNEGHVKWVCLDHYRENYKGVARKQLQEVVESNGGDFSECKGKISIGLGSRLVARQFFDALQRTRGIHDLDITLEWDVTLDDLRQLETAVRVSNISILKLGAQHFSGPASDVLNRGRRFDPLIDIMTNRHLRSFELVKCQDFFKKISRFPQGGSTETLQNLILVNCDIRTTKDVVTLLNGLPSVKNIKIEEADVSITFSRTEDPSKTTEGRFIDDQPPTKHSKLSDLMRDLDDWSDLNIVHLKADLQTISEYGLHRILARNQQLETLNIGISDRCSNPCFIKETSRILQQLHHPLKRLTLDGKSAFRLRASFGFDHGRFVSATLQRPENGAIDLNSESSSGIYVRIEGDRFSWRFQETRDLYYDWLGILPVLIDAFPKLQVREVSCDDLGISTCYAYFRELMAMSKGSLTKISLACFGSYWASRLSPYEMRNGPFPNLTHFMYDYEDIAPILKTIPDQGDVERLIDWLSRFLPLKSLQQPRQHKMCVWLKNIDMGFGSWDRLLNSIDFWSIHELKLTDCTFSEEILSVLRVVLVDADLDICIDGMKGISPRRKDAFIASFQHSSVRIK